MKLLKPNSYYLVGIKGVAMTALSQCLLDAGKTVAGTDVAEEFVTQEILDKLSIKLDEGFDHQLPSNTDCVIYTAAHLGPDNLLVKQAQKKQLAVYSHAEALAELFNAKDGIAVCGVGGKSTVSAMIAWILEKTKNQKEEAKKPSFAVGVGNIIGLNKTGQWSEESQYFVAEADEYVTDPGAPEKQEEVVARFSYLQPKIIVATNLKFDHPDVYRDFEQTKQVFLKFFKNIKPNGYLLINQDDQELVKLSEKLKSTRSDITIKTFEANEFELELSVPGEFNLLNAQAAIKACELIGVSKEQATQALKSFKSTKRRFEFIGEKNGVKYYDDYAHHPDEISAVIKALNNLYPEKRIVYAFQSHTFSRTKQLFDEFVDSFSQAKEIVMIDIFASAREKADASISSDLLCQKIQEKYPQIQAQNLKTITELAKFCRTKLKSGDIFITLGAGDIYEVHAKI